MAETLSADLGSHSIPRPFARVLRMVVGTADRTRIALLFASLFSFMGVMGKLICVPGLWNFRGYYFILPAGVVTLAALGTKTTWKAILICVPMIAYIIASGALANRQVISQSNTAMGRLYTTKAAPAVLSATMVTTMALFVIMTATLIRNTPIASRVRLIELFLTAYLITLAVGYALMVGRLAGILSVEFTNSISPEGSVGDTRFSPGSAPNEYGLMSSFAITAMLLYSYYGLNRRQPRTVFTFLIGSPVLQFAWIPLAFAALCFTNTRSALIALPGAAFWLFLRIVVPNLRRLRVTRQWSPYFAASVAVGPVIAFIVPIAILKNEHLQFLFRKFQGAFKGEGTASERFMMWRQAINRFDLNPLFGAGYSTHEYIHNAYLQLFCDLGIFGVALLIGTAVFLQTQFLAGKRAPNPSAEEEFLKSLREIGVLSVLWFAATGHNLDHFLTWFVILLVLARGPHVIATLQNGHSLSKSGFLPLRREKSEIRSFVH